MRIPKILMFGSLVIFAVIGVTAVVKKVASRPEPATVSSEQRPSKKEAVPAKQVSNNQPPRIQKTALNEQGQVILSKASSPLDVKNDFPDIDRIHQLFTIGPNKLPIVETVTYTSSVPWLKGRPAWIADYAGYYSTSRHFIARSLNGKADYFTQKVISGNRFNVFRRDRQINFYLLVDLSRCKMGFYYVDLDTNERILLKTYRVGIGRLDPQRASGSLTPIGKYKLGSKIATYKPGTMGYFQDSQVEMVKVFGTRWIPFEQEFEGASDSAKGLGIHGAPWTFNQDDGQIAENRTCIGTYDSDGCVRLSLEDMEELFAIVITKPTFIEMVKDFKDAKLPGVEVATPSR